MLSNLHKGDIITYNTQVINTKCVSNIFKQHAIIYTFIALYIFFEVDFDNFKKLAYICVLAVI